MSSSQAFSWEKTLRTFLGAKVDGRLWERHSGFLAYKSGGLLLCWAPSRYLALLRHLSSQGLRASLCKTGGLGPSYAIPNWGAVEVTGSHSGGRGCLEGP